MNKQALTDALMAFENLKGKEVVLSGRYIIEDAARLVERLLPGECESCKGRGQIFDGGTHAEWGPCPDCSGSGRVWDEGIVEAVAKALPDSEHFSTDEDYHQAVRIVLSAIAQLAENPKNFRVGEGSQ